MPAETIEPDSIYRIRMKKAVFHDFEWFRPGDKIKVIGSVLADIQDDVLDYEKVE